MAELVKVVLFERLLNDFLHGARIIGADPGLHGKAHFHRSEESNTSHRERTLMLLLRDLSTNDLQRELTISSC